MRYVCLVCPVWFIPCADWLQVSLHVRHCRCAEGAAACASDMTAKAPAEFSVRVWTSRGPFTVDVTLSDAPLHAQRFFTLARLHYFDGSPFYRVLHLNTTTQFVAQFGYRAVYAVDNAWLTYQTNNVSEPVVMSNTRGTIAFGTNAYPNIGQARTYVCMCEYA
jgi:hypothetical protein